MDKTQSVTISGASKISKTVDIYNANTELPDNCVHIGDGLFVIVGFDNGKVNIHIIEFLKTAGGEFSASTNGIVLSPFLWQSLCASLENPALVDLPTSFKSISMLKNELFLATVERNNEMCVTLQKSFMNQDFARYFLPELLIISEYQWTRLKDVNSLVTEIVLRFLLKHELKSLILLETEKLTMPDYNESVEKTNAEMVLNVSLCEFLKIHLDKAMNIVFECDGCRINYANQLGHECMTMPDNEKLSKYFNLAFVTFDWKKIAFDFVYENKGLVRFITETFLDGLDVHYVLDCVRKLY
ncbi:hypothetical protein JTE90_010263 [Oedothorax gibbosus]|uniref:Uncharacterized protein n=1 Tax=Oedothorax gibbosus TaxID=931172 RepID=A0AAV6TVG4_9ARAC|nr:hypothetical protein JTE90_010263 [Oedothorax gibbosus]